MIQAIARVNRLHSKKRFGYLIDYRGILKELDSTIEKYQDLAERTQGGFDIDDLKGLYTSMEMEYKKLPGLYNSLWSIFDPVKNKQDGPALRQLLSPRIEAVHGQLTDLNLKLRDDFYAALTDFANCMKVALQSASFFADKSFENKRQLYKDTLKMMVQLRRQVREDAEETVDYDAFADDISTLLDKHIGGVAIHEAEGAYMVSELGKDANPEDMSDDDARNKRDRVSGRVKRKIEQDLNDDPYAKEYFSKLLQEAIDKAKDMFDAPVKQYLLFADFERKVDAREVEGLPNDLLSQVDPTIKRHVQAYYGLIVRQMGSSLSLSDQDCVDFSVKIDSVVRDAVAEYSINPQEIENQIKLGLLPLLFNDLGLDNAQAIIDEVIQITRLGLAGSSK